MKKNLNFLSLEISGNLSVIACDMMVSNDRYTNMLVSIRYRMSLQELRVINDYAAL